MGLLAGIHGPEDLKRLPKEDLPELAEELRSEIIRVCSLAGGHLASSLGAVELTVALHALYDSRRDRLVWDVGHQTYGHKILTGRRDRIDTIRQAGGLAGFTATSESEHDALTVGHASTSLAAALGMALARDARKADYDVVAVIGDGALTGGMALAALNQIGHLKPRMIIVLNDNEMSISENVGAINHYMRTLQVQPWFQRAEDRSKQVLGRVWGPLAELGSRAKKAARRFFDPASNNPFHAMGVRYVGPIDGHDVLQLMYYLDHIRQLEGPTMLHIVTRKGKGYKVAESDPITWHGATSFDPINPVAQGKSYTWANAFGDAASALADADDRVWVITPAMREGSGLVEYSKRHKGRYIDVGIAEDVAVTVGAGLALRGEKPIVAIYSTFLQRGYDQVIHDVSLEKLDVIFAIDRAGLVGGDGATHQGLYDLAYLRAIPNMSIAMPRDAREMRAMLKAALTIGGPKAVRWPRGGVEPAPDGGVDGWDDITWGSWEIVKRPRSDAGNGLAGRNGHQEAFPPGAVWVLGIGPTVGYALQAAADAPDVGVVNARFVKPLDTVMLTDIARSARAIVTVEDHTVVGGLGSAVLEALAAEGLATPVTRLGVQDVTVPHGDPKQQHEELGYGPKAIEASLAALGVGVPAAMARVAGGG
ncbi:MAG: 1-deoxy-D-xylulose-5-phosphate synthase [Trueperaceae bacterium]